MGDCGLCLEGVSNAWQLGGYPSDCGKQVRKNVLLRSGTLSKATSSDVRILREKYKLTTIIDFRTPWEIEDAPDPRINGVCCVPVPVLDAGANNHGAIVDLYRNCGNDIGRFYVEMVRAGLPGDDIYTCFFDFEKSMAAFRSFFDALLNQGDGAVLWHCTGGKDRTGLASVMVLSVLGVDKETALKDFDRINHINRKRIGYICAEAGKYTGDAQEMDRVARLAGVSVPHMRRVFERAESECGSMCRFVQRRIGLSDAEVDLLRRKYLE